MRTTIDISNFLEEPFDEALPYSVKMLGREAFKINFDIDPLNPHDVSFSINGQEVEYTFSIEEDGRFYFNLMR
ncbi:hypothetical protein ESCO47_00094 [Escherichia phage vB_EcoM_ESCO47]|nr:hypothetical protein ESCO47_00094 [Escherichia phage vB_EcoM_ESCO47]